MIGLGWQELLLVLIVGGLVYLLFFSTPARRRLTGQLHPGGEDRPVNAAGPDNAEEILARRFARGDIDQAAFETMRSVIQQNRK